MDKEGQMLIELTDLVGNTDETILINSYTHEDLTVVYKLVYKVIR